MTIRIRLFAVMAQQAGLGGLTVDVPVGMSLAEIQPFLQKRFTGLLWPPGTMLAVNQEYIRGDHVLQENDEVAVIPPVSGG